MSTMEDSSFHHTFASGLFINIQINYVKFSNLIQILGEHITLIHIGYEIINTLNKH